MYVVKRDKEVVIMQQVVHQKSSDLSKQEIQSAREARRAPQALRVKCRERQAVRLDAEWKCGVKLHY